MKTSLTRSLHHVYVGLSVTEPSCHRVPCPTEGGEAISLDGDIVKAFMSSLRWGITRNVEEFFESVCCERFITHDYCAVASGILCGIPYRTGIHFMDCIDNASKNRASGYFVVGDQ